MCSCNPFSTKIYLSFVPQRTKLPPCEHSKDLTTEEPKKLPWKVQEYLNCKTQPGNHNVSNLGDVPSSRASLHGSSSISQLLRQPSSSTWTPPPVFLGEHLQSVAIFYYKVFRVLTNTSWHCHHSKANWRPLSNAHYLGVAEGVAESVSDYKQNTTADYFHILDGRTAWFQSLRNPPRMLNHHKTELKFYHTQACSLF